MAKFVSSFICTCITFRNTGQRSSSRSSPVFPHGAPWKGTPQIALLQWTKHITTCSQPRDTLPACPQAERQALTAGRETAVLEDRQNTSRKPWSQPTKPLFGGSRVHPRLTRTLFVPTKGSMTARGAGRPCSASTSNLAGRLQVQVALGEAGRYLKTVNHVCKG